MCEFLTKFPRSFVCRSTSKYGTDQQRFDHLTFLNLAQCFVCFVWSFLSEYIVHPSSTTNVQLITLLFLNAWTLRRVHWLCCRTSFSCSEFWGVVVLRIWPGEPGTEAPIMAYWACSISNAIGPACGMLALKYISYPAQVRMFKIFLICIYWDLLVNQTG